MIFFFLIITIIKEKKRRNENILFFRSRRIKDKKNLIVLFNFFFFKSNLKPEFDMSEKKLETPPPSLNGLLKWAIANSSEPEQSTNPSRFNPHSEDDVKWFHSVLENIKSPVDNLKGHLSIALDQTNSEEERIGSLEAIQEFVEDLDVANDLHALGGLIPILDLMNHESEDIRVISAWIISTGVQNNPRFQSLLLEQGGVSRFLQRLTSESSEQVKIKLISCISGLVRDCPQSEEEFYSQNGLDTILEQLKLVQSPGFRQKVVFFLQYLAKDESCINSMMRCGVLECCVECLGQSNKDLCEKTIDLLLILSTVSDAAEQMGRMVALQEVISRISLCEEGHEFEESLKRLQNATLVQ